jgi:hypothetical protein
MKDTVDKLLEIALSLMETDKARGDALYEIHRELEEKIKTNVFNPLSTIRNEIESEKKPEARGEGLFRGCTIQTVNVYLGKE